MQTKYILTSLIVMISLNSSGGFCASPPKPAKTDSNCAIWNFYNDKHIPRTNTDGTLEVYAELCNSSDDQWSYPGLPSTLKIKPNTTVEVKNEYAILPLLKQNSGKAGQVVNVTCSSYDDINDNPGNCIIN